MIEIKDIVKSFGKLKVLDQVSVNLNAAECIALIGPNGCGKTTLIKTILGMVIPDSGNVFINGASILHQFEYRNQIGYMPQIGRFPAHMSIGGMVDMMKEIRNYEGALDEDLFIEFKIANLLDKKMGNLSGGTTQKVSATLAFMFNPKILILDEPTAGLDPISSEVLKNKIMQEKEKGKLFLITSHLLNELDDMVTQLLFMQSGKIVFQKTVQQLFEDTQEVKIVKAIANFLKETQYE